MSELKLLNCPFCGGEAEAKKEIGGSCWKVKCKQCSCEVGRYWFHNKNHAIIAWNTRTPMANIVENIVTSLESKKTVFLGTRTEQTDTILIDDAINIVKQEINNGLE